MLSLKSRIYNFINVIIRTTQNISIYYEQGVEKILEKRNVFC